MYRRGPEHAQWIAVRRVPRREGAPSAGVREAVAALIDRFDGDRGVLHLDPALHPWLRDHCPTATVPAVPMAFAMEIAAEAHALRGRAVTGFSSVEARRWLVAPSDVEITVDGYAVELSQHGRVCMRAVATFGAHAPAVAPSVGSDEVALRYDDGSTFHGPTLQAMGPVGRRSPGGAEATLRTRADGELVPGQTFVLDPLLLDAATHPMMSGDLGVWGLSGLAYPIRAEDVRFYGPRPRGEVRCVLARVEAPANRLVFDVWLVGAEGTWCAMRWHEAVVPGGPVLGAPPAVRRAFVFGDAPAMTIGVPGEAWEVRRADLIEPLEGSLVRLLCTPREVAEWERAQDRPRWAMRRLAAKEALRAHLRANGADLHPRRLELVELRDRFVVSAAHDLDASAFARLLGPTRVGVVVEDGPGSAVARVVAR